MRRKKDKEACKNNIQIREEPVVEPPKGPKNKPWEKRDFGSDEERRRLSAAIYI
jgi:hypothetical protein